MHIKLSETSIILQNPTTTTVIKVFFFILGYRCNWGYSTECETMLQTCDCTKNITKMASYCIPSLDFRSFLFCQDMSGAFLEHFPTNLLLSHWSWVGFSMSLW